MNATRHRAPRQRVGAVLRGPEAAARATLDSLPTHIAIVEADGLISGVNRAWRQFADENPPVTGSVCEGANYLVACDRAVGDDAGMAKAFADGIRRVLAGHDESFALEYPCHSPTARRWFVGRVTRFAGDGPVRVVIAHEDITLRALAEQSLRDSEERFRRVVVGAPFPALLHAEGGEILLASDSWCDITGYRRDDLKTIDAWTARAYGDRQASVKRDIDALYRLDQRALEGDYTIRIKDGTTRVWEFGSAPVGRLPDGRRLVLSMAIDVTERRRLEQQQTEFEVQLRQQQRLESLGTLAGGVAHEINNPVNGIMNYAQLLQDRLPPDSPLIEFTAEIVHETERVAAIVNNLLAFSRNERQHHSPARMVDIVDGTLSLIRTVIRHDQILLAVDVPADLPPVRCRSQQIQQVLMNLMTNARDALNQRFAGAHPGKILRLTAQTIEAAGGRRVRVTVEDHGTGVDAAVRGRMFDPFFTTKSRDRGSGLGLAISHGIVEEHGGTLTVDSVPGRYTRMHVDLPVDGVWKD